MTATAHAPDWLPPGMVLAVTRVDAADLDLRAADAGIAAYRDHLIERRRREYLAGRLAARDALQALGATQLIVGRQGAAPRWPEAVCGSISHSGGLAVAVVAHQGRWRAIGVDLEGLIGPSRIRVVRRVMGDSEYSQALASADPWIWTRSWSAKEAAYKCLSALGIHTDLADLVPHWTGSGCGIVSASAGDEWLHIDLRSHIQDDLMWVLASLRDS